MGEARAVMRALKEERDEIKGQLDAMQVRACVPTMYATCAAVIYARYGINIARNAHY